MKPDPHPSNAQVPPDCRETVDRLQSVLDGDLPVTELDADPHPLSCITCQQRIAAARLLIAVLRTHAVPGTAPTSLTDRILNGVSEARRARRRTLAFTSALALAAGVALAVWLRSPTVHPDVANHDREVRQPDVAARPQTIRIGDEFSKAGFALLEAPRSITDSTSAAPEMIAKVTSALTHAGPAPEMDSPGAAIAEIPDMARVGLEPLTGTAQKAFSRLMHDVGTVQFSTKPKS